MCGYPLGVQAQSGHSRTDSGLALGKVRALRPVLSRAQAEATAQMLGVVSNPTRLQILSLIDIAPNGRTRIADLTPVLQLRQPSVSHHMKVMTEAGILSREPVGREAWYSIVPDWVEVIRDLLR